MIINSMKKPELLLPAGSPEAFHAAVAGGADAVYLGLSRFNARGRAKNFNLRQLAGLLGIAREKGIRVYITLNTLIRNSELEDLLDTLHIIAGSGAAAVIIQDWGVYYLIRKYFPDLEIHASTQMGIHNSIGAEWLKELGFTRAVLARELTLREIAAIEKCGIELEVFVHGALCYSFSGHCLFSSWLGGMSANRGLCRQPCRRLYRGRDNDEYMFSLNDLQLVDKIPELSSIGVDSLKIEGRMKNAEYVYTTARAYRMVLDDPETLDKAKAILEKDLGRMKTGYFTAGRVKDALGNSPFTGLLLGKIRKIVKDGFTIIPAFGLTSRSRIRIMPQGGHDSEQLKVRSLLENGCEVQNTDMGGEVTILTGPHKGKPGDNVYLSIAGGKKFSSKILPGKFSFSLHIREQQKREMLGNIRKRTGRGNVRPALFVRIDSLRWMPKIFFNRFDFLLLKFTLKEMANLDLTRPFLKKNISSLIPQLPLFIPQNELSAWRKVIAGLEAGGIRRFALAQPGQQNLLPDSGMVKIMSTEDAYILNDAAALAVRDQGFTDSILPLENDLSNLEQSGIRSAVVPLFSFPPLFRSRMPVGDVGELIRDRDAAYRVIVRDGVTTVTPDQPAAILQHRDRLEKLGYRRFLIDLSWMKPSQNAFNRILGAFEAGKAEKQARLFNFKDGLQ